MTLNVLQMFERESAGVPVSPRSGCKLQVDVAGRQSLAPSRAETSVPGEMALS